MIQDREFLVAKLAELDTSGATQQDLEACYYERAYRFYTALSDPALARLGDACGEPVYLQDELQQEHDHDQSRIDL